ncbi:hypothetical protein NIES4103_66360 [Nostoc sp. NIES-4103]|nr:hypothetical protein NIES4103_66360 [Nostoc sp. NIES-4103]
MKYFFDGLQNLNTKLVKKMLFSLFGLSAASLSLFYLPATAQNSRPLPNQVDISCRPALYFGGKLGNPKDMNQGSRYVVPGQKIILTKADSLLQSGDKYAFNIGYYVFLKPGQNAPSLPQFTNRLLLNNKEVVNQHGVKFSNDDSLVKGVNGGRIKVIHTQAYLPLGESVLVLSLDDDKTISETDENNNVYRFIVTVQP